MVAAAGFIAFGIVLRTVPGLTSNFPLTDGGMFFAMAQDITNNNWALPRFTTYNHTNIPFAYPPLGLYLLAPVNGFDALRWMPAVWSVTSLLAFAWLAVRLLGGFGAVAAISVFAVSLPAFDWLIAGGGVTRGLGMTLALVSIVWSLKAGRVASIVAGVTGGLAMLAHPEAGVFSAITLTSFLLPDWRRWLIAGVAGTLVTLPWLMIVLANHGAGPLLAGFSSHRSAPIDFGGLLPSGLSLLSPVAILGFMGLIHSVVNRRWRELAWVATVALVLPLPSYIQAATYSILAGHLLGDLLGRQVILQRAALAAFLLTGVLAFALASGRPPLTSLSLADRIALTRLSERPDDLTLAIIRACPWAEDAVGEWAPVLADRHVTTTVQGVEWLGPVNARRIAAERVRPTADLMYESETGCD